MRVVRLCRRAFPNLDGVGSSISGGRWNSPGNKIVYTASCGALAVLEYRVSVNKTMPKDLLLLLIEVPNTLEIESSTWHPSDVTTSRRIGDEWLKSKSTAVLRVPSVLVPRQTNYLLNPEHPLFGSIQVVEKEPFVFDSRLMAGF